MSDSAVRIERVNQPLEADLQNQILALWEREKVKIDDRDSRLAEVLVVAWKDSEVVGVSSAGLILHEGINQQLFTVRALVDSDYRQQGLAYQLYPKTVESLEARFDAGEDIRGIGVYVEVQAELVADLTEIRCSFSHEHSTQQRQVKFNLTGFSDTGLPQYVYYFQNASLFDDGPIQVERSAKLGSEPGLELRFCWNTLSDADKQQIIGLWTSYGVISDRQTCIERLPQVAAIALEDGQVVAVSSIFRTPFEAAKTSFIGFRSFASPDARTGFLATKLLNLVYEEFNKSYCDDEVLRDTHGVAYVLQNEALNQNVRMAMGPDVGSGLIGFLGDMQLRCKYFDGAVVKR